MAVTVADVAEYTGASATEPLLPTLLATAEDMVEEFLGADGVVKCPVSVLDLALLQLSSELWERRKSPNGVAQWGPDGQVVRMSRDAMVSVKPLLARYAGLGSVG